MAIPFKNPDTSFIPDVQLSMDELTAHFKRRKVPRSKKNQLLLATWNIANLGAQKRSDGALKIIAHLLKRFDLIAVQEVNDRLTGFFDLMKHMGTSYDFVINDTAGNSERLAYIYKKRKVKRRNLTGELALRKRIFPKNTVTVEYREDGVDKTQKFKNFPFEPFDRNPFIASFVAGAIDFVLVNVHLYFGKFGNSVKEEHRKKYARRVLEIYALSKWAKAKFKNDSNSYDKDIILLGDMNIPMMSRTNSAYKALIRFGMIPINYQTKTGFTNIKNDKTYDQVAFAPNSVLNSRILDSNAFDFDKGIFKDLWSNLITQWGSEKKALPKFNKYVKHHISDHRPIWVLLDIA